MPHLLYARIARPVKKVSSLQARSCNRQTQVQGERHTAEELDMERPYISEMTKMLHNTLPVGFSHESETVYGITIATRVMKEEACQSMKYLHHAAGG